MTNQQSTACGRRKKAICRLTLTRGRGAMVINRVPMATYLHGQTVLINKVLAPYVHLSIDRQTWDVTIRVYGGGLVGQADAIELALSRALVQIHPDYRVPLRRVGSLTQDARVKERKKYGLKKARKSPQFSKR